jgi:hypothetical protein
MIRMSYSLRALVAAGVAATCALLPATALAGTYSVTQTLNADTTGWAYSGNPGFTGCSKTLVSGTCSGLTAPSPLYIIGSGAAVAGTGARWVWTAPQGLSVSSGSVMPYWSIAAKGTTAYLQTATAGQTLTAQPRQLEAAGASSPTWAIPSGTTQLAVALSTSSAVTYPSALSNVAKVSKLQVVLSDTTAPTVSGSVVGVPSSGSFAASTTQVCVNVSAGDVGSGVTNLSVKNAAGTVLASFTPTAQSAFQPGAASVTNQQLCVPVAKLTQGTQTLTLAATDAGGNTTTTNATVKIDAAAPVATVAPAAGSVISSRQPDIHVNLSPGAGRVILSASGFLDGTQSLTFLLSVDSTSLVWSGGTDLSVGKHTVSWTATDNAGNTSQGSYSFTIAGPTFTISGSLASNAVAKTGSGICGTVTATDSLGSVKEVDVYVDGKFQSSFFGPSTPGALVTKNVCLPATFSDGLHTLRVRGTDSVGGTTDQTTPFSVDTAGPTIAASGTLISSELAGTTRQCASVTANDPNGISKLELRDENGTAATYSSPNPPTSLTQALCLDPSTLSQGTHTVDIIATDSFGVQTDKQYTISVGVPAAAITYSWDGQHTLTVSVRFDAGPYTLRHYDFSTDFPQGAPSGDNGGSTATLTSTYGLFGITSASVYWHATDSQGHATSGEFDIQFG